MRGTRDKMLAEELAITLRLIPNFSFVSLDRTLSDISMRVIMATGLKSADAIYVGIAFLYRVPLITLDKEQLEKGKKLVEVRRPNY
jgi:predicted nucleic acid-binding protein